MPSCRVFTHLSTSASPCRRMRTELTGITVLYQYAGGRQVVISASLRSHDSRAYSTLIHVNITIPGRKSSRYCAISIRTWVLSDHFLEMKSVRMDIAQYLL